VWNGLQKNPRGVLYLARGRRTPRRWLCRRPVPGACWPGRDTAEVDYQLRARAAGSNENWTAKSPR